MQSCVTLKKYQDDIDGWTAIYAGKVREWKAKYLHGPRLLYIYKEDGETVDHTTECMLDVTMVMNLIQHLDDEEVKGRGWVTDAELEERDADTIAKLEKTLIKISGYTPESKNEEILHIKYIASEALRDLIKIVKNI